MTLAVMSSFRGFSSFNPQPKRRWPGGASARAPSRRLRLQVKVKLSVFIVLARKKIPSARLRRSHFDSNEGRKQHHSLGFGVAGELLLAHLPRQATERVVYCRRRFVLYARLLW